MLEQNIIQVFSKKSIFKTELNQPKFFGSVSVYKDNSVQFVRNHKFGFQFFQPPDTQPSKRLSIN